MNSLFELFDDCSLVVPGIDQAQVNEGFSFDWGDNDMLDPFSVEHAYDKAADIDMEALSNDPAHAALPLEAPFFQPVIHDALDIASLETGEPSFNEGSPFLFDESAPSPASSISDLFDFMVHPHVTDGDLVTPSDFSADGAVDNKNGLVVVGDVANDIQYVDQQTAGSCSLMAQEQFVDRYIGRSLPEDYLEWQAEKWGVYSPEAGTNYWGQVKVLDHFEIPYERTNWADIQDIERALDSNHDLIVGVDARDFYNDPTIPPGSGHAVAIVGKGIDPSTQDTAGYYFTDSNYPGTVRFLDVSSFGNAWQNDMISIPNVEKGTV